MGSKVVATSQEKGAGLLMGKKAVGVSFNNNLELMCIIALAFAGIIIKLSFSEKPSSSGVSGPATCSIWGYGLTAIALSILVFMGINLTPGTSSKMAMLKNILPIALTLFIVLYSILLNFSYFTRINKNAVSPDYRTYSYMSVTFIILQVIGISAYLYYLANKPNENNTRVFLSKAGVSILGIINLVFVIMIHITLDAFSTDESGS
jgi:hypothetical protein